MRHSFGILTLITVLAMAAAHAGEADIPEPQCPPDPRAEDVPELLYSFDNLTHESFEWAQNSIRNTIPEWIEEKDMRLRKHHANDTNYRIFDGELWMAYQNTLAVIEGYTLKLEYIAANENERSKAEKRFCDFVANTIVID